MYTRKPKHYKGVDASGECHVLPPSFGGIKQLVMKFGEAQAAALYPSQDLDDTRAIVSEFLSELAVSDPVERQTLTREFKDYVTELQQSLSQSQAPGAPAADAPAAETEPEQTKDGKADTTQE